MQLTVLSKEPVLFETGDSYEARLVPSAGTGRAILEAICRQREDA